MNKIMLNMTTYFFAMFTIIFLVGIYGMIKIEYAYPIIEDNLMNENATTNNSLIAYNSFKNSYIMTDTPLINLLNMVSFAGLVMLFSFSAKSGWTTEQYSLKDMMINYSIVMILVLYLLIIVMNYLINVFVNQLLLVLFNDIISQVWAFNLFYNYFIGVFLICVFLSFMTNQIRNYRSINV